MQVQYFHHSITESRACYSSSTLLIPERFSSYYRQCCNDSGSRRAYFSRIVRDYLPLIEIYKFKLCKQRAQKWKTCFQDSGQKLLNRNFVPLPDDWENLRHAASGFGVSICYLFVFLMQLEMSGIKPYIHSTGPTDWNPTPKRGKRRSKFGKISKFRRTLDANQKKLIREIQIQ